MKRPLPHSLRTGLLLAGALRAAQAQTPSASSTLVTQPLSSRTVSFGVSASGVTKSLLWGMDTALASENNMRRGVAFMGTVDIVRASFQPTLPLVNGDLQPQQINDLNYRLYLVGLTGATTPVALNCDHPSVDAWYLGNAARWAQLMNATTSRVQAAGRTVVSISPFNEPDYGWGQFTGGNGMTDFYNICGELRNIPRFSTIRLSGGNTLSCDAATPWYNYLKTRLDEGNTHQLAGSFNGFANFFQQVRAEGKYATGDEMHNVAEAMVGYEYGMQTGIWWAAAELARGEFCKASRGGVRLGYAEHRPNWTAASIYRAASGKIQAFGGTSERQAVATTYRFVSKERDVYYDGYGPQREYGMMLPGGTGYQQGQTNAERVVNVTWGEDIQPAINGTYVLVNRSTGQVLQVAGGSNVNGANIQQDTYTGATSQQFSVAPVSARVGGDFSYFSITAVHSGKAVDVYNRSLGNGDRVAQYDNNVANNQQWYLDYAEDGWFYVRSRWSAKCLDVDANGLDVVQQDKATGRQLQQWRLLPVGAPIEFMAPSAPTGLAATARPESVLLSWVASPQPDVAGYDILRAEAAAGPFNTIARKVAATAFVDNTATVSGQYFYKVRAVDNSQNRSAYSAQVAATTTGTPEPTLTLHFDGNSLDSTPNLNHSAVSSGASYVAGRVGSGALALNGTTGFVQLPPTVANQQQLTVAAWVYWNGGAVWQRLFDFGNDETQSMYLTPQSAAGTLRFGIRSGGVDQLLETTALPTGAWTHVAVTLGAAGGTLYVNGQPVAQSGTLTLRPLSFTPAANYIGRSQYADPLFNGQVDEFNVYNYALPPASIAALATAPAALARQVTLYPNPATGSTTLELPASLGSQFLTATLLDAVGREVRTLPLPAQGSRPHTLDLRALPAGVYALRLATPAGPLVKQLTVE